MFGFGKPKVYDEDFDYDAVVSRYEGEMIVGDYVAESLNRVELNKLGNEYHVISQMVCQNHVPLSRRDY